MTSVLVPNTFAEHSRASFDFWQAEAGRLAGELYPEDTDDGITFRYVTQFQLTLMLVDLAYGSGSEVLPPSLAVDQIEDYLAMRGVNEALNSVPRQRSTDG